MRGAVDGDGSSYLHVFIFNLIKINPRLKGHGQSQIRHAIQHEINNYSLKTKTTSVNNEPKSNCHIKYEKQLKNSINNLTLYSK